MSARADTNCHDILNFVSATRTHLAKIGATRCVVADMSRHVGDISTSSWPRRQSCANKESSVTMQPRRWVFCLQLIIPWKILHHAQNVQQQRLGIWMQITKEMNGLLVRQYSFVNNARRNTVFWRLQESRGIGIKIWILEYLVFWLRISTFLSSHLYGSWY